jgi:hypothetical protein
MLVYVLAGPDGTAMDPDPTVHRSGSQIAA